MTGQATPPRFVDTHAHLDEPVFDADREAVLAAASAIGVSRVINVGFRPARWATTVSLSRTHRMVDHMLGLHPHHADEWSPEVRDRLSEESRRSGSVALGEIGLDYYRPGPDAASQRRAFAAQLALARELGLPVVIHQRAAEEDLIEVLRASGDPPAIVLHSFEGSDGLARFAVERGFFVGVGGLATRAGMADLRSVLSLVPSNLLLLETDAPYLVPAGVRERRNVPANIPIIAERLAPIWKIAPQELAAVTTENAERVFGLAVNRAAQEAQPR